MDRQHQRRRDVQRQCIPLPAHVRPQSTPSCVTSQCTLSGVMSQGAPSHVVHQWSRTPSHVTYQGPPVPAQVRCQPTPPLSQVGSELLTGLWQVLVTVCFNMAVRNGLENVLNLRHPRSLSQLHVKRLKTTLTVKYFDGCLESLLGRLHVSSRSRYCRRHFLEEPTEEIPCYRL